MLQLINLPTRVTTSSETLLDNFFTNLESYESCKPFVICEDISDHFPIACFIPRTPIGYSINQSTTKFSFNLNTRNISAVRHKLSEEDWEVNETNPSLYYNNLIEKNDQMLE